MTLRANYGRSNATFCAPGGFNVTKDSGELPPGFSQNQSPELVDGASVDLEDYYQVEAFADRVERARWPEFASRVRQNTERTLELLNRTGTRATFFVLGYVAERDPALIREVAAAGHEIACHSHLHRRVHTLTPMEFREDVRRARGAIEDAAGVRVLGFRAPTFSVTVDSLWALDILLEEGFEYDSSIFPVRHDLYGIPDAPRFVHQLVLPSGRSIWEIPMSTVRMGGVNFPAAGGGYLRLIPLAVTRWAIRRIHRRDGQPVILYFHPWELDPEQPRLRGSWKSRFRHYSGLKKTEARLQIILTEGKFQPLINLVRKAQQPEQAAQVSLGNGD
jgi:polysaccharide deacetylase family protein (PEP-CTERM system associated)